MCIRDRHAEAADLTALVRDTVDGLAPPMAVTLQLAAVPPQLVDPTRLRLLLRNLLENTRRHAAGAGQAPELFLRHDPDGQLAFCLLYTSRALRLNRPDCRVPVSARCRGTSFGGLGKARSVARAAAPRASVPRWRSSAKSRPSQVATLTCLDRQPASR